MRSRNIFAGLVFAAFAAWYGYLTSHLTERTLPNTPGPSFFPTVLTIGLFILSIALLIQGLRETQGSVLSSDLRPHWMGPSTLGLVFFAVYLLALPYLGFLLATPFFFGALMWAAGERRPIWIAAFSVGIPIFLYGLFEHLFLILLPAGEILG